MYNDGAIAPRTLCQRGSLRFPPLSVGRYPIRGAELRRTAPPPQG